MPLTTDDLNTAADFAALFPALFAIVCVGTIIWLAVRWYEKLATTREDRAVALYIAGQDSASKNSK